MAFRRPALRGTRHSIVAWCQVCDSWRQLSTLGCGHGLVFTMCKTASVDNGTVVVGGEALLADPRARHQGQFRLGNAEFVAAIAPVPAPVLVSGAEEHAGKVLIEVRAFSCNYRDRGILLGVRAAATEKSVTPTGSELCAEVLAVGRGVSGLSVGDRVLAANDWPSAVEEIAPGVPTDQASRRYRLLDHRSLVRIPDAMTDHEAAAFSLGAQTAYGMVRRLALPAGAAVLVTAASSSTSLFAIGALRAQVSDAQIVALTASGAGAREARVHGADVVVQLRGSADETLSELVRENGGFAAIVDPFHDLYFRRLAGYLGHQGTYMSCGFANQYAGSVQPGDTDDSAGLAGALRRLISRCGSFVGHCLGTRADLDEALADYLAGRLRVPLDSVHTGPPAPFLQRSWSDVNRVGKVVYAYGEDPG